MPATERPADTSASAADGGLPPVLGVLLRPARPRSRERVAARRAREHGPVRRDGDRLDAGRADVEADEGRLSRHGAARAATRALALDDASSGVEAGRRLGRLRGPGRPRADRPAPPRGRLPRLPRGARREAGVRTRDDLLAHAKRGRRRCAARRARARAVGREGGREAARAHDDGVPAGRSAPGRRRGSRRRRAAPRSSTGSRRTARSCPGTCCSAPTTVACGSAPGAGCPRARPSSSCGARSSRCSSCRSRGCSSRTASRSCGTAARRSSTRSRASVTLRRAPRRRARRREPRPCATGPREARRRRSGPTRPR